MTSYMVDSAELETAVAGTYASMDAVRTEHAGLLARLEGLQASWTGGASAAFQLAVEDWRAAQLRVEESMGLINGALGSAATSYASVETDVQALFR